MRRPIRSKRLRRALGLATASLLFATSAGAQWELATDVTLDASGVTVTPRDLVTDDGSSPFVATRTGSLPDTSGLAAIHIEPGGDVLYVSRIAVELPGPLFVGRDDVVRISGATESVAFDGGAAGVPEGTSIDALSGAPGGDLLLSFDRATEVGGMPVHHADLVRWDGATFSLFFDADTEGVPTGLGVDAAHYDSVSDVLDLSFDASGGIGGVTFDDEDVLAFDRATSGWSLAFDGSAREPALATADVVAVAVPEPACVAGLAVASLALTRLTRRRRT